MNDNKLYQKERLKNGLRVITLPMPSSRSVTVMVMVKAGSRYEQRAVNGLSHFMEHMFFKGAEKYPDAMAVSSAIDSVGGVFNAFTSEDKVAYFVKLSSAKKTVAYDVLSDMLLKSKFDSDEIDRERGVIIEEIRMYNDDPMSKVQMDFKLHFYGDQPLGWDIAGPEEVIQTVKRDDFINFRDRHYTANNCVLTVAGDITHDQNMELAEQFFNFTSPPETVTAVSYEQKPGPRSILNSRDIEQAHFTLGFPIPGERDKAQPSLKVLSNILGGTMSSRLFHEIRERRGLAYYIRSSRQAFADTGALRVSAGINVDKLADAIACVVEQTEKMASKGITPEELERGKENIKGRMDLALEDSMSVASYYSVHETMFDEIKTPAQTIAEIDAVSVESVNEAGGKYLDTGKVKMAALGPYQSVQPFDKQLDG